MQDQSIENGASSNHPKKTIKKLGIWMDHTSANLIIYNNHPQEAVTIKDAFTHEERESSIAIKEEGITTSEIHMHNKEQQQQQAFYTKLSETIKEYDEVLLFGPTEAKSELVNFLKIDHHFDKIKIETKPADKMTENQQHAFVKEYFS